MPVDRAADSPVTSLSFEDALSQLQEIVVQLESGSLTLDQSIATFRLGSDLAAHCQHLITEAELRVSELSAPVDAGNAVDAL